MLVLTGRAATQDGKPDRAGLQARGPLLQVALSALDQQADILTSRGVEVPVVTGLALIDSGASATCIDDAAAAGARLPAVDTARMSSASGSSEVGVYAGKITLVQPGGQRGTGAVINAHQALGVNIREQGIIALIGRDILSSCILIYNGVEAQYTLAF